MGTEPKNTRCPSCGAPSANEALCPRCAGRATNRRLSWLPSSSEGSQGILLENKYRLLDEIGRGGMGTVFQACDESLDRLVAVKFLLPELQTDEALVQRFHREAKAMASVRHENVLQIFSFGQYGSANFFVMEHIEGETAERLLEKAQEREEFIPLEQALSLLSHSAAGLGAVHRAGVVHRDIKPANIMIEAETGRAVIMDFGIGKRYTAKDSRRTQSPSGTPAYMAPEVVSGQEITSDQDHLSDVYAFGVTAFELLTSTLPFEADNWVELCVKHVTVSPPAPSSRRKNLPSQVDEFVLRCLEKLPQKRFQSCGELREALDTLVADVAPHRPTPLPPGIQTSRGKDVDTALSSTTDVASSERLIVADPSADVRFSIYQVANDLFPTCSFLAAKSSSKAVSLALESPPLLMVAPLRDPDLNGLELAATLLGHSELRNVHLVLTADRVTSAERETLEGLGVYQVLLKPIDPDEVRTLLADIAHEARNRRSSRPPNGRTA